MSIKNLHNSTAQLLVLTLWPRMSF